MSVPCLALRARCVWRSNRDSRLSACRYSRLRGNRVRCNVPYACGQGAVLTCSVLYAPSRRMQTPSKSHPRCCLVARCMHCTSRSSGLNERRDARARSARPHRPTWPRSGQGVCLTRKLDQALYEPGPGVLSAVVGRKRPAPLKPNEGFDLKSESTCWPKAGGGSLAFASDAAVVARGRKR